MLGRSLFFTLCLFHNFANSYLRLFAILYILLYPISMLINFKCRINLKDSALFIFSIAWILLCSVSFLFNSETFKIDFNGAGVELFTPFLFILIPLGFLIINNNPYNIYNTAELTLKFTVGILILDLLLRYYESPSCFLNYSCRFEAKTVGLFSTTNALGLSLLILLASLRVAGNKIKYEIFIFFIFITTMARASIIAYIFFILFYFLSSVSFKKSVFILFPLFISIIYFAISDPLNLSEDGSANSKIEFFTKTYEIFVNTDNLGNVLFGYGSSLEAITDLLGINGWSPHVPVLKVYLYYGILGVVFYFISILLIYNYNKRNFLILFSYIIAGLAGAPIFTPALVSANLFINIYKYPFKVS
jgi:hypothetical protein